MATSYAQLDEVHFTLHNLLDPHPTGLGEVGRLAVKRYHLEKQIAVDKQHAQEAILFHALENQARYARERELLQDLDRQIALCKTESQTLTLELDALCQADNLDYEKIGASEASRHVCERTLWDLLQKRRKLSRRLTIIAALGCSDVQLTIFSVVGLAVLAGIVARTSLALTWGALWLYVWALFYCIGLLLCFTVVMVKGKIPIDSLTVFVVHTLFATLFTLPTTWFHSSLSYAAAGIWLLLGVIGVWRGYVRPHSCNMPVAKRGDWEHLVYAPGCVGLVVGVCFPPGSVQLAFVYGGLLTVWLLVAHLTCQCFFSMYSPVHYLILLAHIVLPASFALWTLVATTYATGYFLWFGVAISACGLLFTVLEFGRVLDQHLPPGRSVSSPAVMSV